MSDSMTPRELDILQAMVEGLNNAEIARRLVLSAGTVKWYVKQLYSKLDTHSREEAVTQALALGLAALPLNKPKPASPICPLINPLPQDVTGRYVGNTEKLALLSSLLRQPARLVSIYGRGGSGKTALACKTLVDLRQSALPLNGIVCLSAVTTGVSLNRVFTDLGRLLAEKEQNQLEAVLRNTELTFPQKIAFLIEKLVDKRIILLLDNLETVQNPATGEITEPGLHTFIEMVLKQTSALTLLVTSREPLPLTGQFKTWEHLISLEDGLNQSDAVALLRKFDPAGVTGLRDAPAGELAELAERLGGFPRALESVAGMLLEDPLLPLAGVKQQLDLLEGDISAAIVRQALNHLSDEAMRLLQALAVFGQPVTYEGLAYLLEPYLAGPGLRALLGRLIRASFVKANLASRQFALHPLDQAYCYNLIPVGSTRDANSDSPPFTRLALHRRVAAYYHQQRLPLSKLRQLADLEPQLNEFKHLVSAEDYAGAAKVLLEIDRDLLWEWGYRDLLQSLYSMLGHSVTEPRLAHHLARRRTWLKFFWPTGEAEQEFAAQLESARQHCFVKEEAEAWDDLAQIYRRGNQNLPKSLEYHHKALTLFRQVGDRRGEAEALGGLGAILVQSSPEQALGYLLPAIEIQRELGNHNSLSFLLTMAGTAFNSQGENEQALKTVEEAVQIAEEWQSLEAKIRALGELSRIYASRGDIILAREYIEKALAVAREFSGLPMSLNLMFFVCQATLFLALANDEDTAIEILEKAVQEATLSLPMAVPFGKFFLSLLYLLNGNTRKARSIFPYDPGVFSSRWSENNCWVVILFIKAGERETAASLIASILTLTGQVNTKLDSPLLLATAYSGLALLQGDAAIVTKALELNRLVYSTRYQLRGLYRRLIELLIQEPGGEILAPE